MKITDQITAPDRSIAIVINSEATKELSEFFEHVANVVNLSFRGEGSPENNVTAPVGATYNRLDENTDGGGGSSINFYVKEAFTDDTGWSPK